MSNHATERKVTGNRLLFLKDKGITKSSTPRIFHCSEIESKYKKIEIFHFTQL